VGAEVGSLVRRGHVAAWILWRPTQMDTVTGGGGVDDAANTVMGGVGKLSVIEMREYVGKQAGCLLGQSAA
jgi:hypothetical protein